MAGKKNQAEITPDSNLSSKRIKNKIRPLKDCFLNLGDTRLLKDIEALQKEIKDELKIIQEWRKDGFDVDSNAFNSCFILERRRYGEDLNSIKNYSGSKLIGAAHRCAGISLEAYRVLPKENRNSVNQKVRQALDSFTAMDKAGKISEQKMERIVNDVIASFPKRIERRRSFALYNSEKIVEQIRAKYPTVNADDLEEITVVLLTAQRNESGEFLLKQQSLEKAYKGGIAALSSIKESLLDKAQELESLNKIALGDQSEPIPDDDLNFAIQGFQMISRYYIPDPIHLRVIRKEGAGIDCDFIYDEERCAREQPLTTLLEARIKASEALRATEITTPDEFRHWIEKRKYFLTASSNCLPEWISPATLYKCAREIALRIGNEHFANLQFPDNPDVGLDYLLGKCIKAASPPEVKQKGGPVSKPNEYPEYNLLIEASKNKAIMKLQEIAELLKISTRTIYRWRTSDVMKRKCRELSVTVNPKERHKGLTFEVRKLAAALVNTGAIKGPTNLIRHI